MSSSRFRKHLPLIFPPKTNSCILYADPFMHAPANAVQHVALLINRLPDLTSLIRIPARISSSMGTMDVLITDPASIRALSRMIACAAKIGEHVMLTTQPPSNLCLRVINPSHSTFAHFRLFPPFFAAHSLPPSSSAKLSTRSLLPLLRAPHAIATLRIALQPPTHVLFELKARSAVIKRFRVPIVEGRIGVTAFDKRTVSCVLQARARLFLDVLANFHARLDEVTLAPAAGAMRVASFVDDVANPANLMLRTEMTLASREFDLYTFPKSHAVPLTIFCKYLRAALEFCDPFDLPLRMWFEAAGQPVLFDIVHDGVVEAAFDVQFIFASRHAEDDSTQRVPPPSETPPRMDSTSVTRRGRQVSLRGLSQVERETQRSVEPFPGVRDAQVGETNADRERFGMKDVPQRADPAQPFATIGSSAMREEHTITPPAQGARNRDVPLPPSKRPVRSVFEDGEHDSGSDEDDDYVEGTPPPL